MNRVTGLVTSPGSQPFRVAPADGGEGMLLAASGQLKAEQIERVRALQAKKGLKFGAAAVQLGYVTEAQLQRALAEHFDFPYLTGPSALSRELVCAYAPFGTAAEAIRNVRTRLLMAHFRDGRRSLAMLSAQATEGRSYLTANLAVAFAQLHLPTVIVDADLRAPRQHDIFGLGEGWGLSTVLAGRMAPAEVITPIAGFPALSLLPAGIVPPNPQELLACGALDTLIGTLERDYEVVLIDTPAWGRVADAQLVAARASASLLVTRPPHTRLRRARRVLAGVAEARGVLIGTVVNQPGGVPQGQGRWRRRSGHR